MAILSSLTTAISGPERVSLITPYSYVITLDASLSETHGRRSPATEYEIEDGSSVNDHIILGPQTLELVGLITDTPVDALTALATAAALAVTPPGVIQAAAAASQALAGTPVGAVVSGAIAQTESPSATAYLQLLALQGEKTLLTVLTTLFRYENMAIVNLTAPRDSDRGNCLEFTLSLQEMRLVTAKTVNVAALSNPNVGAARSNLGGQQLITDDTGSNAVLGAAKAGFNDGTGASDNLF